MNAPSLRLAACVALTLGAPSLTSAAVSIDAVYFAQTHVQKPGDSYFGLVSGREALIKAHVADPGTPSSPAVSATLDLGGSTLNLPMTGPGTLPASIPDGPGVVEHLYADSFTAIIPAAWVQPGLEVTVTAGAASTSFTNLEIGAPTKVIMTMFDVQYFADTNGDYPAGTLDELAAKWPVAELELRRIPHVVFTELVIPPRAGVAAARVTSKADYLAQTGLNFDGEQAAALAWNGALKRAAGRSGRVSLYYTNIYGVGAGGQAGGFAGVGNGTAQGILHHELGHALSLPHWGDNGSYPYKGDMFGIAAPAIYNDTHAGPTWAFDLPSQSFIPCTVQPGNVGGKPTGTYKADPMQGGGTGFQESGYLLNHFSDYSMDRMRNYLQGHVLVWDEGAGSYAYWNQGAGDYTNFVSNNGVQYPIERDVQVISLMASISGAKPDVCMVYPPIGPFSGGLIKLFDPTDPADRAEAAAIFAPAGGCDLSMRIQQGGAEKIYMLAAPWEPGLDPLSGASLKTEALNLPAADGEVTRVELLLTPDAEVNGLPADPEVLSTWAPVTPDPASFAAAPSANNSTSISMTATTGFSPDDPVEYRFLETTGNPGGSSSNWQSSPSFTDTGLQPGTHYGYTVTMRAGAHTGTPSAEACATTDPLPGDTVDPTLAGSGIVDDAGGGPVDDDDPVTYFVNFSEPMDASTVTTDDFENAGSVLAVIESVTPTCDLSVWQVVVAAYGNGTLQLRVKAGANLEDLSGNSLDTTTAITDDTVITVTGETIPPTLVSIGDDVDGGPVFETETVTYTVTFDEPMNAATVNTGDFDNAGSPAATIISASPTGDPAVFEVAATPGGAGTLRLRIASGATLEDLAGNLLVPGSASPDDTVIDVFPTPVLQGELGVWKPYANGGINPATGSPWAAGDTYRLAFVTSTTTTASSTDIEFYNAFVQGVAAGSASFPDLGDGTWKVLGSTQTVNARVNTGTDDLSPGAGEPIFLMDGATLLVASNAELWDGNPFPLRYPAASSPNGQNMYYSPYLDEEGVEDSSGTFGPNVATGSLENGTSESSRFLGGSTESPPKITHGNTRANTSGRTIRRFNGSASSQWRFYALSAPLAVSAIPVPPTAFETWAESRGLTGGPGLENGPADDPDGGGKSNLYEFGFGGDPRDATDDEALMHSFVADGDGDSDDDLLLTIAVRAGATWTGGPTATATIDGISYSIGGSAILPVNGGASVSVAATPVTTGLAGPPAGYEWKTFILDGSTDTLPKGYLQATVSPAS